MVVNFTPHVFLSDQPALNKNLKVAGNGCTCGIKMPSDSARCKRPRSHKYKYLPSGRIGYCLKDVSPKIHVAT